MVPLNFIQNLEFDPPGPGIDYVGNHSHGGLTSVHTHELTDGISDPVLLKILILDFLAITILFHQIVISRPSFWTIMLFQ